MLLNRTDDERQNWRFRAVAGSPAPAELGDPTPPSTSRRLGMVRWFAPLSLLHTAIDVLVSSVFGRHADVRTTEALTDPSALLHDFSDQFDESCEFWFDFVADVGDGWNSTYAIARAIATPALDVGLSGGKKISRTRGGRLLIFGGDEIYPTPTQVSYQARLENVYRTAFQGASDPPIVFAIPGNHDWYDSLVAFSRLFLARRSFGPCRTLQNRSYFALKLPHNWWLLAVDIQLGADIDAAQMRYFEEIAKEMDDSARVILCVSEPHWIHSQVQRDGADEGNLVVLEEKILKHRVMVFVAGDLHHYVRHAGSNGVQKITCGGGGAFLHPTHRPKSLQTLKGGFERQACFPEPRVSAALALRLFAFPAINPEFLIVPATAYTLTAMFAHLDFGGERIWDLFGRASAEALVNPLWLTWLLFVLAVCVVFADRTNRLFRILAGAAHGATHLAIALSIARFSFWVTGTPAPAEAGHPLQNAAALALIFFVGAVVGSFVFGCYLFSCLTVFGKQLSASFSALRIQDWKSFLRFQIDDQGRLQIYAIGIERVARRWRETVGAGAKSLEPDARATPPHLIERVTLIPSPVLQRQKMCDVQTEYDGRKKRCR